MVTTSTDENAEHSSENKQAYQQAISFRKTLEELKHQSENSADKTMLTLSSGALALSLTFIGISSTGYYSVSLLTWVWVALAAALIATLVSHRTSALGMEFEIEKLDRELETGNASGKTNRWNACTRWLNGAALLAYILGTALFVIFCCAERRRPRESSNGENLAARSTNRGGPNRPLKASRPASQSSDECASDRRNTNRPTRRTEQGRSIDE